MATKPEPAVIVIFGASGDLTRRKLGPALHSLTCAGLLPAQTQIVGVARSSLSDAMFREQIYAGVQTYSCYDEGECSMWENSKQHYTYLSGDYDDPETYYRLVQHLTQLEERSGASGNRLFYPLQGDASLFIRADEIELAWGLIDPLTEARQPALYPVGSWGPPDAAALIAPEQSVWHIGCVASNE